MVQIIQKIRHELAQKYRPSGAGHTYQDASYEIVTDPKVIVRFLVGSRVHDSIIPGNISNGAKIPIQVLHNIGVKVINIIFPHNASKVVFYDMKSNQLYDTEGFHIKTIAGCDPLIISTSPDGIPTVILDRLQDYYRRLYSSFNIQKQDIVEDKSHHEIQKLREQIKTISKRLGNESPKNLRQFTISSLSKINNKLRVIEQKLQRSRKVYKTDQKGQFIP